jgi:hypothetical protein
VWIGNPFLKKEIPFRAVRIALHYHRAILQVRQQDRRNIGIILQQIPLGDSALRPGELVEPEEFVEMGELDFMSRDLNQCLVMAGRNYYARFSDCGGLLL